VAVYQPAPALVDRSPQILQKVFVPSFCPLLQMIASQIEPRELIVAEYVKNGPLNGEECHE
jgi:hypothetical protein